MIDDAQTAFYGEFLRHAVESSLQAINEVRERACGRPMSHLAQQRVKAILSESLAELQRSHEIGTLDTITAERIYAEISAGLDSTEQKMSLERECLRAVLETFGNFAESLAAFGAKIEQEGPRT